MLHSHPYRRSVVECIIKSNSNVCDPWYGGLSQLLYKLNLLYAEASKSSSLILAPTIISCPGFSIKTVSLILFSFSFSHETTSIDGDPLRSFSPSASRVIFTFVLSHPIPRDGE